MARQKRRKNNAVQALRAVFIILLVGCVGLAAYLLLVKPGANGPVDMLGPSAEPEVNETATFAEGVYVANIALAGKTLDEAKQMLSAEEKKITDKVQFQLSAGDTSLTLTAVEIKLQFDTEKILQEAIALGNVGNKRERDQAREELLANPKRFDISYEVDTSGAEAKVAELAERVRKAPVDASVTMDMTVEGFFAYAEGAPGEELDGGALLASLKERAQAGQFGVVELPILYEESEITIDKLKSSLIRRGAAETSFAKSPYNREDRVYNVKKAAGMVNGFCLKPGEVFSTNNTLGDRTYALGWKPAPAIVRGSTEDQAGGGVCQVSSTLYNAVVKADLEIVTRRNHSSSVSYVPRGLDATINTGTIDFQFKNNTASDIYIFAYTFDKNDGKVPEGQTDKTVHVEIYGEALPDEYDKITLTSEKIETLEPAGQMEVIVDNTKAWDYYEEQTARKNGSVYQSYKHYFKGDKEVKVEPLAKSTYAAYAGTIIVGPGYYSTPVIPATQP